MSRMIDADKLIEALPIVTEDKRISLYGAVADFMVMISEMPTVDAVEVVRCHECRYWQKVYSSLLGEVMCCIGQGDVKIQKEPYDFCSCGERRTE